MFQHLEHVLHEDDVIESSACEANVSPNISFEAHEEIFNIVLKYGYTY